MWVFQTKSNTAEPDSSLIGNVYRILEPLYRIDTLRITVHLSLKQSTVLRFHTVGGNPSDRISQLNDISPLRRNKIWKQKKEHTQFLELKAILQTAAELMRLYLRFTAVLIHL